MKNTVLLSLASATLFFACNSGSSEKHIVKKWTYHEISMNGKIMTAQELGNPTIDFKEDGKYILSFGPMSDSGKWELRADTGFYTISEVSQSSQELAIMKLSKDTFRLKNNTVESDLILTMIPAPKAE
jgi:hypothetical protein